ncbi:hypothetical protein AK812_SmicGene8040 [Symbiodinium microadriaticum]|uniref:Uncharacterized protein n=1 Tax=Symbiodinium microadriaticum TaxID=2951 RepID=A0A1Q9ELW9_SYMMI|nr:hypothetical protein AK812_SmicGene8040 [Symbiodinium microadriaticum]
MPNVEPAQSFAEDFNPTMQTTLKATGLLMEPQRSDVGRPIDEALGNGKIRARAPHTRFQLHFESVLAKVSGHAPADFVVCAEAQGIGGQAFLIHNTRIKPEWLTELA